MINNLTDNSLTRLFSDDPLEPQGVKDFFSRLRGMIKLRGWRKRDSLILLVTIIVHLILAPLRFVLLHYSSPNSKRRGWIKRLDLLGYTPLFDCVVISDFGVFRLRRQIHNVALVCLKHEQAVGNIFQPKEGEVVVDVGTHIGTYTMPASRLAGSHGKVIAIEAEPSNFNELVFNLKLNQAHNVIPLNIAAWDKEATLDLHLFDDITSHSLVFLPENPTESVKIRARPLDKMLEEMGIKAVDWIKIDVQGAEVEVLRGLEKTMSRSPNLKLIVEVHSEEISGKCLSILKDAGYEVRWISHQHLFASPVARLESSRDA